MSAWSLLTNSSQPFNCAAVIGIVTTPAKFEATVTINQAYLILASFGIFCAITAKVLSELRLKIYREKANVDRTFDAGGQLSMGLTAATIVSEWTWSAAFVQSSSSAVEYGISGIYWYATGATIFILLFSVLCMELKIRAPGAKTYLKVIRVRFGKRAHITFCVYALLTNIIVTSLLLIDGGAILSHLVEGMSTEYACTMILLIIGSYSLIGGVGATSYVNYFGTLIIMAGVIICLFEVFHRSDNPLEKLGTIERVYNLVSCNTTVTNESYFTFNAQDGFTFGIVNMIRVVGSVFLDQSYWQRSVASKPREGAWGFLSAGLVWFAIPFAFSTTMGLAYIALGTLQGQPLLTPEQEGKGLIPAIVIDQLMGHYGAILFFILIIVAVSSTGAAEILAIVSILIYDLYGVYWKPYGSVLEVNICQLCNKEKRHFVDGGNKCTCENINTCVGCEEDDRNRENPSHILKDNFKCEIHAKYRKYNEHLERYKNWVIVLVTIGFLPTTIIFKMWGVEDVWLFNFMGILLSSGVFPLCLSMCWRGLKGTGIVAGMIMGSICGVITWLIHSAQFEGGLSPETFMINTGEIEVMLSGNCVSLMSGLIISVTVSHFSKEPCQTDEIWEDTLCIDNPISPWQDLYTNELSLGAAQEIDSPFRFSMMKKAFSQTRRHVIMAAVISTTALMVIGPIILISIDVFSEAQFYNWMVVVHIWIIGGAIYIIFIPLMTEFYNIRQAMRNRHLVFPSFDPHQNMN